MTKIQCPKCKSTNTCRIMYGLPAMTDELQQKISDGRIALGGCLITEHDPDRHCNDCENDFFTAQHQETAY